MLTRHPRQIRIALALACALAAALLTGSGARVLAMLEPGPKEDEPPKKAEEPDATTKALLELLKKDIVAKQPADRVKAIKAAAAMGEKALPVARDVCGRITDANPAVGKAAIEAVQDICPDLYDPVLALLKAKRSDNILRAATQLGALKEKAAPAIPVVLYHLQFYRDSKDKNAEKFVRADLEALRTIDKADESGWGLISTLLQHPD